MFELNLSSILERAERFSFSDSDLSDLLDIPKGVIKTIRKMFNDGETEEKIIAAVQRRKAYTIEEIKDIVSSCAAGLDIGGVSIIGSYAKSNPGTTSDIDFLVIDVDDDKAWERDNDCAIFEQRIKDAVQVPTDILYYTMVLKSPMKESLLEKVVNVYGKGL